MPTDTYLNFADLIRHEERHKDFSIFTQDLNSPVTIFAPHGGRIEPHTSDIAKAIAGDRFNCYCFEGLKNVNNGRLHITSHNYDEPEALYLLSKSFHVIVVHACKGTDGTVYIGGLDHLLKTAIKKELLQNRIRVVMEHDRFPGINPENLCNRGIRQKGVQLEITRDLRDDWGKIEAISLAVQNAIDKVL